MTIARLFRSTDRIVVVDDLAQHDRAVRGLTRRRIGDDGRLCWGLAWPGIARRLFPRDKPPRQSPDCDPQVRETVKRTVRPYFELDGNICALLATRDCPASGFVAGPAFEAVPVAGHQGGEVVP